MKKLMALLLALVMVMSLAACGEQKTNENSGDAASGDAHPPRRDHLRCGSRLRR